MCKSFEEEISPYIDIPTIRIDILRFIYDLLHHQKTDESTEIIYKLFSSGYCYYLAKMLEDAFPGGTIVWCAPYGHIAYRFNDVVYDIHYVYDGDSDLFVPIERMGRTVDDFRKIRDVRHDTTKDEISKMIKENQDDCSCRIVFRNQSFLSITKMEENKMKFYFVKSDDLDSLKLALGQLIEYAKFLEDESGRSYDSFVDHLIHENGIDVEIVDQ